MACNDGPDTDLPLETGNDSKWNLESLSGAHPPGNFLIKGSQQPNLPVHKNFRDCHYDLHQPPCGHSYQSNDMVKHGPSVSQPHLRRLAKWEFKIWCQMNLQTRTRCLLWTTQTSNNRTSLIFRLGWPKHTPVSLLVSTWIIKSSSKTREFPDGTPSSTPFSDSKKAALSELLFIKKVQMTIRTHSPKKQEVIPLVDWTRSIEVYPWYTTGILLLRSTWGNSRLEQNPNSKSLQFNLVHFSFIYTALSQPGTPKQEPSCCQVTTVNTVSLCWFNLWTLYPFKLCLMSIFCTCFL